MNLLQILNELVIIKKELNRDAYEEQLMIKWVKNGYYHNLVLSYL